MGLDVGWGTWDELGRRCLVGGRGWGGESDGGDYVRGQCKEGLESDR